MIRVMVVDDHPVVRDGLTAILELQSDMQVVGEAADGPGAVALAQAVQPDVIIMDLELPGFDGAEALAQIKRSCPATQVIILTAFSSDQLIVKAVRAGASGYLLKGAVREELVRAVRIAAAGGSLLQPALVARLMDQAGEPAQSVGEPLTEREREVLGLLVEGLRNKEIADRLAITERTVKFHVGVLFQKLGVSSRAEAVRLALTQKIVS
jgi:DNA-binding NarL/FixJ family response regulator